MNFHKVECTPLLLPPFEKLKSNQRPGRSLEQVVWIRIIKKYLAIILKHKRKCLLQNITEEVQLIRLHRELQQASVTLITTFVAFLQNHRICICYINTCTCIIYVTLLRFFLTTIINFSIPINNPNIQPCFLN